MGLCFSNNDLGHKAGYAAQVCFTQKKKKFKTNIQAPMF